MAYSNLRSDRGLISLYNLFTCIYIFAVRCQWKQYILIIFIRNSDFGTVKIRKVNIDKEIDKGIGKGNKEIYQFVRLFITWEKTSPRGPWKFCFIETWEGKVEKHDTWVRKIFVIIKVCWGHISHKKRCLQVI